ncbi:MAG TPA: 4Fe-4S binding protein [Patescibacteria group bacterium]|nr:4Fe-4S binding protein [Patescibacteria group bacterium]
MPTSQINMHKPTLTKFQKVRKTIQFLLLIAMPVVFAWMSPIVIMIAGFQRTVNMGMVIFSLWFISSLFLGRSYCSFLCMGGAGQEIFGHLIKKPPIAGPRKRRRIVRYIIFALWLGVILFVPLTNGGFLNINPFFPNDLDGSLPFISIPREVSAGLFMYFGMQLLSFVILTHILGNRAFCQFICPISVLGDIGSRIGRILHIPGLKLHAESEKCIQCKECNHNCQMGIDVCEMAKKKTMIDADCIFCGECIDACSRKVIRFKFH